jgi:hypothetical protein
VRVAGCVPDGGLQGAIGRPARYRPRPKCPRPVAGPLGSVQDVISTKKPVTQVGDGNCYEGISEKTRTCGAIAGGIVVLIDHVFPQVGKRTTDQQLVTMARAVAAALS